MKICYLSNSAMPSKNASAIQIVKMCEAFSQLNNEVVLITTNVFQYNTSIFKFYDVKKKFILDRVKNFEKFPLGINYYFFSIFSILKSFKYKPDIYITRNFFSCFLLVLLRKRIVIELHHGLDMESRVVRFLVKYLNFLNSNKIVKAIAITKNVRDYFLKYHRVKKDKFLILPSGTSIKKKYFNPKKRNSLNIGYLGSLYKSRGSNLIIKLAQIDNSNNYYLYGDNKNLEKKNFIRSIKNLRLKNQVPYKEISKILSTMDVLIMPYTSSVTVSGDVGDITNFTSPLKLFDYLSMGKTILCSNLDVLREVVKEKKNVVFINNFENIYAWKNEIDKIKILNEKRLIISKNNFDLSKRYTLKNRAKKILENI